MTAGESQTEELATLLKRRECLGEAKIRAEEALSNSKERLQRLQEQARKDFGTADLDALKARLSDLETENQSKLSKYRAALEEVEKHVDQIKDGR